MSNLLKVGTTISKSERIIDYNDIIKDRVEAARAASRQKADSDGFINGLNADVVERLPEDEIDTEAAASEEMNPLKLQEQKQKKSLHRPKHKQKKFWHRRRHRQDRFVKRQRRKDLIRERLNQNASSQKKNRNWNSSMHSWQDSWKKIMNSAETIWNHRLLKHCCQYLPK